MALSEKISSEIIARATTHKHDDIVNYLKEQLKKQNATAKDILYYARTTEQPSPTKRYLINADIINKLGVIVDTLDDKTQKKLAIEFYKLAAERNNHWGARNYALTLIDSDPEKALEQAQRAVELAESIPDEQHEHKFILCQALRANKSWRAANMALMEYLTSKSKRLKDEKNTKKKESIENEIKEAIALLITILKEFAEDFKNPNSDDLTEERCRANLAEIDPILGCNIDHAEFIVVEQSILFIKGKYHEKLGEKSKAWAIYCAINDDKSPIYNKAITARKRLLKSEMTSLAANALPMPTLTDTDDNSPTSTSTQTTASPEPTSPTPFSKTWEKETTWFDTTDTIAMKTEFEERRKKITKLIADKEKELSEADKDDRDTQNIIETDLEKLKSSLKKLKESYEKSHPQHRKIYRRHKAETTFFNPSRSKKTAAMIALAEKIIDHRFNIDSTNPGNPIDLTGKSSRLLISAERMFQEAVIALSENTQPQLGIPVARKKPWELNGYSGAMKYGAVEYYQTGQTQIQAEHRADPKRQRFGDSFLPEHGTYSGDIYPFLSKLTNNELEKEKQLATFMIRYGQSHQSVTLAELQTVFATATQNDIDHFNKVCFLLIEKEQSQWHSATEERYQWGASVAQARCLIMIEAGFISFQEAFKNNVLFGVYSHTKIIDNPAEVAKSCQYIEKLYTAYLQSKRPTDHMKFFKKYIKEETIPQSTLTRTQAREDMQYVYGGESDTDGEGYETDLSM